VVALEVEAWEERANDTMQEIAKKILNNHNLINIGIVHLTGYLNIGDPIVYIVIKSIHRKEAFVALEEAILAYKQGSPVWKKEIYADGSSNWITTASKV
ncbi:MAG: molybdenum cofactor biosynthesis protein MoaE, partial [Candidatus Heimdallarchaeota archaeon]|nr:molybdenum cofactor biosynthesis protein MoaE [Candidatus Heimdallarchaeota archaeon]